MTPTLLCAACRGTGTAGYRVERAPYLAPDGGVRTVALMCRACAGAGRVYGADSVLANPPVRRAGGAR